MDSPETKQKTLLPKAEREKCSFICLLFPDAMDKLRLFSGKRGRIGIGRYGIALSSLQFSSRRSSFVVEEGGGFFFNVLGR